MVNSLFSIITINYNNKNGLIKTINSVLNQDFQDYEYIIIDGGSSDGSKEIIESYVADSKYKEHITFWCSEKDKGIYNAMNKGLSHATGQFINMMNSGDALCSNILTKLAPIAEQHKNEILYGAVNLIENGSFTMAAGRSAEFLPQNMIAHQSCFVPSEIYKKYGPYDESFRIVSDYDKFLCFYKNHEKFFYTNLIIADYDFEGLSTTNLEEVDKENIIIRKKYGYYIEPSKKELRKQKIKNDIKRFLKRLLRW
jgi:glycosyltransferase involved in cell wall biosynthesis